MGAENILLLLEESLAQQLGERGHDALISHEHIVEVAQLALLLVRLVLLAQLADANHLA